jgi:monoamine oxidase
MHKKANFRTISWFFLVIWIAGCSSVGQVRPTKSELSDVDVIIVGAGMAGLTAAKELEAAGKSFLVLEAQNRIGGRAMVEKSFPIPVDLGAAWFHGVEDNPLVPIADKMGFHRVDTDLNGPVFVGKRKATEKELKACEKTAEELDAAMLKVVKSKKDKAVGALLPSKKPCADLIASNIGPLESGIEINKVSSITAALFNSENDDFIREGLGTFVAAYGKNIPVRLNSVVNKIEYSLSGVNVSLTTGERFHAKRVLVTVSTGVLAAGKIAFDPPLPAWKLDAIKKLPMGLLNKVVMQFKKDIFKDTPKNSWVLWDGPGNDNIAFVIRPLDAPMAIAFYGGETAKAFEKNETAALNHAKKALSEMYGDSVESEFERSALTSWGQNPWTLGSYSYVTPGASQMYGELQKPVSERVFFAGEACARPEFNGSIHGAYESSLQASGLLVTSLEKQ